MWSGQMWMRGEQLKLSLRFFSSPDPQGKKGRQRLCLAWKKEIVSSQSEKPILKTKDSHAPSQGHLWILGSKNIGTHQLYSVNSYEDNTTECCYNTQLHSLHILYSCFSASIFQFIFLLISSFWRQLLLTSGYRRLSLNFYTSVVNF